MPILTRKLVKLAKHAWLFQNFPFLASCVLGASTLIVANSAQANEDHAVTFNHGQVVIESNAYPVLAQAYSQGQNQQVSQRAILLKAYALRVGQQYGYAKQLQYLQDAILKQSAALDQIFNFNFILSYANNDSPAINVLPPVLLKAKDFVQDHNGQAISIADVHYTLYTQAQLVTSVPSWRNYLIQAIPKPETLVDGLLPHDSDEQATWQKALYQGWALGIHQGDEEMSYRIRLLNRDYNGMLTYLTLLEAHKVLPPYVAYSKQAIVGDDQAMSVNQSTYRISANAKLVTNPKNNWQFLNQKDLSNE